MCHLLLKKILPGVLIYSFTLPLFAAEQAAQPKAVLSTAHISSVIFGLLGVLLLIVFLAMLLKKVGAVKISSKHIKIIETQNLSVKEKLIVVQLQSKQYLLGVTQQNINLITELSEPIENQKSTSAFHSVIEKLLNPHKLAENKSQHKNRHKNHLVAE